MDKNLLCAESCTEDTFAGKDKVILDDHRVLDHLLQSETIYMPEKEYFKKIDLDPDTRKIVAKWMLEVCEEEGCLGPVLPLAINLFDRFLCKCNVPTNFLQLIAADCLLIANHSVTPYQLRNFETLIVTKLKWDLAAVTSFDFIDQILQRVDWCNSRQEKTIRTHSLTLLHICCTEVKFYNYKPSIIAAASILSAMKGIQIRVDSERLSHVCSMVQADVAQVEDICSKIERSVSEEMSRLNVQQQPVSSKIAEQNMRCEAITKYAGANTGADAVDKVKKPETPVDVQNVNF